MVHGSFLPTTYNLEFAAYSYGMFSFFFRANRLRSHRLTGCRFTMRKHFPSRGVSYECCCFPGRRKHIWYWECRNVQWYVSYTITSKFIIYIVGYNIRNTRWIKRWKAAVTKTGLNMSQRLGLQGLEKATSMVMSQWQPPFCTIPSHLQSWDGLCYLYNNAIP